MKKLGNVLVKEVKSTSEVTLCDNCGGRGSVPEDSFGAGHSDMCECYVCAGTGRVTEAELLVVAKIPYDFKSE